MSQTSPVTERDDALVRDLALAFAAGKYEGGETLFEMYANIALKFMETRGLAPTPAEADEDHSDCVTARERELYFALMGLAGAVMSRRREWDNWMQGGIKIAPVVRKALRLDASDSSTG